MKIDKNRETVSNIILKLSNIIDTHDIQTVKNSVKLEKIVGTSINNSINTCQTQ